MKELILATVHTTCVSLTAIGFVPLSFPRSPVMSEQPDHFRQVGLGVDVIEYTCLSFPKEHVEKPSAV